MKQADTQRHNLYQSQRERKKMNTLDGKKIIGYTECGHSVTIFTESPTGDSTDSLQFVMNFDSWVNAKEFTTIMNRIYQQNLTLARVANGTQY